MRMARNHFADSSENALYGVTARFNGNTVVSIRSVLERLTTSLWAAQRQTAYRYGKVNAIFNPVKVLLGDDEDCLKDDGRSREWLQ